MTTVAETIQMFSSLMSGRYSPKEAAQALGRQEGSSGRVVLGLVGEAAAFWPHGPPCQSPDKVPHEERCSCVHEEVFPGLLLPNTHVLEKQEGLLHLERGRRLQPRRGNVLPPFQLRLPFVGPDRLPPCNLGTASLSCPHPPSPASSKQPGTSHPNSSDREDSEGGWGKGPGLASSLSAEGASRSPALSGPV